jgi:hypothetical protein
MISRSDPSLSLVLQTPLLQCRYLRVRSALDLTPPPQLCQGSLASSTWVPVTQSMCATK